ncbi:MAG: hypothetical protein VKL00_01430 [Synechococcales bacterium]|nr:hypothetical protein [Synechococcales bacterium]
MPVRYAHRPALTATRSRNAILRFRLSESLRTRNDSLRRWLTLLSHFNHIAGEGHGEISRALEIAKCTSRLWQNRWLPLRDVKMSVQEK